MRSWTISLITTVMILGQAMPGWAGQGDCGQPKSRGAYPQAVDALYMLHVSVDMKECELGVCDVDADCGVTVRDVLATLGNSVAGKGELGCNAVCAVAGSCGPGLKCRDDGAMSPLVAGFDQERDGDSDGDRGDYRQADYQRDGDGDSDSDDYAVSPVDPMPTRQPQCVCVPVAPLPTAMPTTTSTTMTWATTTSTSSTTMIVPAPTTTMMTPPTTMTTTTLPAADASSGMQIYDNECGTCHLAGSHDRTGFAPDLTGKIGKLRRDIASLTGAHPAVLLYTQQEIDDLKAFLNGL